MRGALGMMALVVAGCAPSLRVVGPSEMRDVVIAHRGAVMACYESYATGDASTGVLPKVTIHWRIEPDGQVSTVDVVDSTISDQRIEQCLVRQVRSWRFPAARQACEFKCPFEFGARYPGRQR